MNGRFRVESWAAAAAGLTTRSEWESWFRDPAPVEPGFVADASAVPAAIRRRLGPLGRAALAVALQVRPETACPLVFLSRHGELRQTAELLAQLAAEGAVSPMGFSLSVHNAIPGIYSIVHADRSPTTCIAANRDLVEAGVIEALGWLSDGCGRVMIVFAEDIVPEPYEGDDARTPFRHAWACVLADAGEGGIGLHPLPSQSPAAPAAGLPDLRVLAFLTDPGARTLDTGRYRWQRHA